MMKRVKILFIAMLALASCQLEEDFQQVDNNAVPMTFYAGIELPEDHIETKTILGGSPSDKYRKVLWEADDEVYVTNETYSSKFINIAENGANLAILEGELSHGCKYLAAYPYDIVTDYTSSTFNVNLPTVQEYFEDGIDPGTFPMVAKCNNGTFNFQNICGIFVLQLLGEKTISALTFSGEGETGNLLSVAGNGTVSMDYDDHPTLNLNDSSSKTVKLNCSNGVALNNENPSLFHIILPDGTYHNFKVVVEATDGSIMTITSTKPLRIKRSTRTTAAELTYGDAIDLSEEGTANCYIVNNPGNYSFDASVKGNSSETVGSAETAEVLWESFGTEIQPEVGDVIKNAKYEDGKVKFDVPLDFKEGNAVIAVKDASGKILWSWHIWVTDLPKEHVYPNNVSIVMDRNLGATSARPGDVTTHGLIYQWGRKDPFLGSVYDVDNEAKSTITWPAIHTSSVTTGTIEYTINNPTTFIEDNTINNDWHYNRGYSHTDNTRWGETKTIYDPCPLGWKVPNNEEIDMKSLSNQSYFDISYNGVNFNIANSENTWYPLTGYRIGTNGNFSSSGGEYWTTTTTSQKYAYTLKLEPYSSTQFKVYMGSAWKAYGYSVRCVKDNSVGNDSDKESSEIDIDSAIDLSSEGTANSYIVSSAGVYSIPTVKGNTLESVGNVVSIDVLWESFGTNESVSEGDLIAAAMYNNGKAYFKTNNVYRKGNAVIAARDGSGIILWSWHIWLTDTPVEDVYYNNSGTLMDRNLGATSSIPGDICAQGLLYQWGRKDPFMGSSSITKAQQALTSKTWPSPEQSSADIGTIEYATNNPMTFIIMNNQNNDWLYSGSASTDHERWKSNKTIYDPCPVGWKVPEGGENSIWYKVAPVSVFEWDYNDTNQGMDFYGKFGDSYPIWYPAHSYISESDGKLYKIETYNAYWSVSPSDSRSYTFNFTNKSYSSGEAYVYPYSDAQHADANAVRCIKEGSYTSNDSRLIDYVDEYGVNHGKGTEIDGVIWAPVNCGYKAPTDDSKGYPYGKLYQWGRKYGQGYSATYDASTPTIKSGPVALATGQSSSNANVFYTCTPAPYNWCNTREDDLWSSGGYSPCPSGWRVPTADELGALDDNKSEWTTYEDKTGYWFSGSVPYSDTSPAIFLPAAGLRYYHVDSYNGGPYSRNSAGIYWSSKSAYYYSGASNYWTGAYVLRFNETDSSVESSKRYRAYGYSVRCVQE